MGVIKESLAMARGVALGAGLMFLLDPIAGRRRRSMIRDRAVRALYEGEEFLEGAVDDLSNRARGLAAETISAMRNEPVTDEKLTDRIRAAMGRIVSHPRAVKVTVHNGIVTLSGPIFSDEAPKLIYTVSAMRGVTGLENRLESHSAPTDHPALQGTPVVNEPVPEFLQTNWTDGPRLIACLAGCLLAFKGARRGGILGSAVGLAGMALMGEAAIRTPAATPRAEPCVKESRGRRRRPKLDLPEVAEQDSEAIGAEAA